MSRKKCPTTFDAIPDKKMQSKAVAANLFKLNLLHHVDAINNSRFEYNVLQR